MTRNNDPAATNAKTDQATVNRYRYVELIVDHGREWVYEKKAGQTISVRVGTERKKLWERVEELGEEGWRVVAVHPVQTRISGAGTAYLLERKTTENTED